MTAIRHRGLFTIPVTPFTAEGALDVDSLRRVIAFCVEGGAHGIVAPVNASEFTTLTPEERQTVTRTVIQENQRAGGGGRVPIVNGVGAKTTAEAVRHTKLAEDAGADAVIAMPAFDPPAGRARLLRLLRRPLRSQLPAHLHPEPRTHRHRSRPAPRHFHDRRAHGAHAQRDPQRPLHQGRERPDRLQDHPRPASSPAKTAGASWAAKPAATCWTNTAGAPAAPCPPAKAQTSTPSSGTPWTPATRRPPASSSKSSSPSSTTKPSSAPPSTRKSSTAAGSSPAPTNASPAYHGRHRPPGAGQDPRRAGPLLLHQDPHHPPRVGVPKTQMGEGGVSSLGSPSASLLGPQAPLCEAH